MIPAVDVDDLAGRRREPVREQGDHGAGGGLGVDDFERRITVQTVTPEGLRRIGPVAAMLAEVEGLDAHAASARIRFEGGGRSGRG